MTSCTRFFDLPLELRDFVMFDEYIWLQVPSLWELEVQRHEQIFQADEDMFFAADWNSSNFHPLPSSDIDGDEGDTGRLEPVNGVQKDTGGRERPSLYARLRRYLPF